MDVLPLLKGCRRNSRPSERRRRGSNVHGARNHITAVKRGRYRTFTRSCSGIFLTKIVFELCVLEQVTPDGIVEVDGRIGGIAANSLEPVVKHDMELGRDLPRTQLENQGKGAGVASGNTHVNLTVRALLSGAQTFSIGDGLRKNVGRAAKNVKIVKALMRPASSREDVVWGEAGGESWHVIENVDGLLNGHRPPFGVNDAGPVDGSGNQHGTCQRNDSSNRAFCNTIVMMGANASELVPLMEGGQVTRELGIVEGAAVV